MLFRMILYTILLLRLTDALAISSPSSFPILGASVQPLYLFPNGTAAENLLVREDGSILMTMLYPTAALYYFPRANSSTPTLLYNFSGSAAAYGISEYAPGIFAVCTGTFSRSGDITNATGVVWKVDLAKFRIQENGTITSPARVSILANLTDIGFLNGATTLDANTVLVADSVKGVVYAVDTQNGSYSVALNDSALAPNATGPVRLGVNGLAKMNDVLYFTNTNHRSVGKVPLTVDGNAAGPYESVATNVLVDDLDVDPSTGVVYIASLVANAITYVEPNGTTSVLVGSLNSTDVPGPTAIKFAKRSACHNDQRSKLLISTSGGFEYPINGTYIMGGGLYELDFNVFQGVS